MDKKERAREKRLKLLPLIGVLLIVAGVSLALFPALQNIYYQHKQAQEAEDKREELKKQENVVETPYVIPDPKRQAEQEDRTDETEHPDSLKPEEGLLEIPRLDLEVKIGYGVELSDLEGGPGFYPESEYPDAGNVAIAGHRTTYGAPFRYLNHLQEGDEIHLYYNDKRYIYHVDEVFATHSRDWSVTDPTEEPALTLTTCHPPGLDTERLIVRAYLETIKSAKLFFKFKLA